MHETASSPEEEFIYRKLGIDIGRVIMGNDTDNPDRSVFGLEFLKSPSVEGSFESIRAINDSALWGEIHLISKCRPAIQRRTVEWLLAQNFFKLSGVDINNVHFCLRRSDKAKIAEDLHLTHFIDDRLDVLTNMSKDISKIHFDRDNSGQRHSGIARVESWEEALNILAV